MAATTSTATTNREERKDGMFHHRIKQSIRAVKAWDEDPTLLTECRSQIPWSDLRDVNGPYSKPEDQAFQSPDARFLQRLARYFQSSMTWVNAPPCSKCGLNDNMEQPEMRGPETDEEKQGEANRVEVYRCSTCSTKTTFPRYNSARKLLETRKGRCGEYANLFGLVCRSAGFETRYIHDVTDHVWVEAFVDEQWIMADSCEGVINEPSMYEAGWGKSLSYTIAVSSDYVLDVTCRYTRKFHTEEFQSRRRAVVSSEAVGERTLQELTRGLRVGMPQKAAAELDRRLKIEKKALSEFQRLATWESGTYEAGRSSGSLLWKISRNEAGTAGGGKVEDKASQTQFQFHVESFFPLTSTISIEVKPSPTAVHGQIVISGTDCAVGRANSLSVVVVDEEFLGCILLSRAFCSLKDLARFVETLPKYRVVAICGGRLEEEEGIDERDAASLSLLGGFDRKVVAKGVLFIGQVQAKPDWSYCTSFEESPNGFIVQGTLDPGTAEGLSLRTEKTTRPSCVVGRLPESIMPLPTQLLATEAQKRAAFLANLKREKSWSYFGYTTKPGSPIYLLGESSYPFERVEPGDDSWNSFLLLPPPLVADDDVGIPDLEATPNFEIPVDTNFFVQNLGPELLVKKNGVSVRTNTATALENAKLVAFYFSAHWCGPCRSFTPMLIELYQHLKDEHSLHGLEIVFVSSDRDPQGFDQYFGSMPWLAVPFQTLHMYKQLLSTTYGVQGIPALVVLDAMSGQIVVSSNESRREVTQACRQGETGIEALLQNWFARIPPESQEVLTMLELSCKDDHIVPDNPYLVRNNKAPIPVPGAVLEPGPLNGKAKRLSVPDAKIAEEPHLARILAWNSNGRADIQAALGTALKYLENVQKTPWSPKFRSFKLANKIADSITRVEGGVNLVRSLGFEVRGTLEDFVFFIPLQTDLDAMHVKITTVLETYKVQLA